MDIEITGGRIFYTFPFEIPILGKFQITETLVVSWLVMLLITGLCIWLTHDLKVEKISRRQAVAELLVETANKFVIGNVARFKTEKNHTFLIDVFNEIYKQNCDSVLLLVGTGELEEEMKKKCKELGIEKAVIFMGQRNDIPDMLLAMDVFFLPSLCEGLPVVAVEAQASGLPVVTSTGVTKEVDITGNVRFLDLAWGEAEWADAISKIGREFKRQDMYQYIHDSGYDITETAKALQEFYLDRHFQCF